MVTDQNSTKSGLLKDLTIAIVGGSCAPIVEFSLSKISDKSEISTGHEENQLYQDS